MDYEKALEYSQKCADGYEAMWGPANYRTLGALGRISLRVEKREVVVKTTRRLLEGWTVVYGRDHEKT